MIQKMLEYNRQELERLGIVNRARFTLSKPDGPSLSENNVDLIFLYNVYHHLKRHVDYLTKAKSTLTQNGRVVIIDYDDDERSGILGCSKRHLCSERTSHQGHGTGWLYLVQGTHLPVPSILLRICPNQGGASARIQN